VDVKCFAVKRGVGAGVSGRIGAEPGGMRRGSWEVVVFAELDVSLK
jgi:hypothetical protein